jgi:two-component system chemotaxis response regulator CheY
VLPSPGPLSGIALERPEDRLIRIDRIDRSAGTSVELEIAVTNRMEELARLAARLAEERRQEAALAAPPEEPTRRKSDTHRLLLVGPRLSEERACIESLRLRGYEVRTARAQQEAVTALDCWSPELVMVDTNLGRFEGIELIPELRQVAGIEEVPVVLVDDQRRPARREAARRVGAVGYLVRPIDVARIADRLARLVNSPRRRRFTRYDSRVSAHVVGAQEACIATDLGRGGMFLATDEDLPAHSLRDCELRLPELGRTLRVQAEVLYRMGAAGAKRRGVGMRFRHFPEADEPLLIEYLRSLESPPVATA